jgi:hypothetical protein
LERAELEAAAALSDEELWVRLGREVVQFAGPADDDRRARVAKAWFETHLEDLRAAICGHSRIEAVRSKEGASSLDTLAAVADLVATLKFGISAATVAVLVTRYGLDRLCS